MNLRPLGLLLALPLWACASQPGGDGLNTAISVAETPLLIAFKIPGCILAAPLMAPGALVSTVVPLQDTSKGKTGFDVLTNGVVETCGPPYLAQHHHYEGP